MSDPIPLTQDSIKGHHVKKQFNHKCHALIFLIPTLLLLISVKIEKRKGGTSPATHQKLITLPKTSRVSNTISSCLISYLFDNSYSPP